VDWNWSQQAALPVLRQLLDEPWMEGEYWNVNLPHLSPGESAEIVQCEPDRKRLDVRFRREGESFHYAGSYHSRLRTPGFDVDKCFEGNITVSRLRL
jgi:5'-nucleotidase